MIHAVIYGVQPQWNDKRNTTKWVSDQLQAEAFAVSCKRSGLYTWVLQVESR